jgi:hypothetical protein
MAEKKTDEPKRLNRTVAVGDAMGPILGPALRRRGFAGRDIITNWGVIAPKPYDTVARPDELKWPRGKDRSAEGATLYLRVMPGHALAVQHEGPKIAAAVNRYFGYVLVREVRMSLEPMDEAAEPVPAAPEADPAQVDAAVRGVEDEGLREVLRKLGQGVMRK